MDKLAFSVPEFCVSHGISRSGFYNLLLRGDGPNVMRGGRRIVISREAAEEWRRAREASPEAVRLSTEGAN